MSKPCVLTTKTVDSCDGPQHFAKLEKNAHWLLNGSLGIKQRGALRRMTLIQKLRAVACPEPEPQEEEAQGDVDDPMDMLDDLDSISLFQTPCKKKQPNSTTPVKRKSPRNRILSVEMPEYEPTANPGRTATRKVRVYLSGNKTTWIHVDDLPWVVKWVADEYRSGGIVDTDDKDPIAQMEPNCDCPGVHLRWDFGGKWEAFVLEGKDTGKVVTMHPKLMNAEQFKAIDGKKTFNTELMFLSPSDRKDAMGKYLQLHMQKLLGISEGVASSNCVGS